MNFPTLAMAVATVFSLSSIPAATANVIDGTDDRDSLLVQGPALGLSEDEIERIRKVSGYVGCFLPTPSLGSGALFLANSQILTAGHVFFDPETGVRRSSCFFKNQDEPFVKIDLIPEEGRFGAVPPKPGSNYDFAVVPLVSPIDGVEPFPVANDIPIQAGDGLIVVTAHPAGMEKQVPNDVPVVQPCAVRRVPVSSSITSFFRSDCDASGSSSGGMNLSRVNGELVYRGVTITTGLWRDPDLHGAPYNEERGSVTTALGTDAAILEAARELIIDSRFWAAGPRSLDDPLTSP
ncbi:MAG: trypsin-like peptidase domain-containing protein [Hyphomicrobiales bacterium]|nr:trypsin-like peptidase domain-containing protein [Hyphomicrobiales bacterium]